MTVYFYYKVNYEGNVCNRFYCEPKKFPKD